MPGLARPDLASRWHSTPSETERLAHAKLLTEFRLQAATANVAGYHDSVESALGYLVDYHVAFPKLELFLPDNHVHNVEVRDGLFRFMMARGSRKRGATYGAAIKGETASGHISTLITFLERLAGVSDLLGEETGDLTEYSQARKHARGSDGLAGKRREDTPIRGQHLDVAFQGHQPKLERTSLKGAVRHAGSLLGHNTVARGADMGHAKANYPIDPARDLTIDALDIDAGIDIDPPMMIVWMHPSKDPRQILPRYPMVVQRRFSYAEVAKDSDHLCTYDAIMRVWPILALSVPREQWATTMFLRIADVAVEPRLWRPLTTTDVASWCVDIATANGMDTSHVGGKSLRMGAASDIWDIYGPEAPDLLKERGRWDSDIGRIYAAVSAEKHGDMSRRIASSTGRDLQSMLRGWRQPAMRF